MVTLENTAASLRVLDAGGKAMRTFGGVRPGLMKPDVDDFMAGINGITTGVAGNAVLTVRSELVDGR